MKVLIAAVGQRVEHWTDLFAVLCRRGDIEPTLALADVTARTEQILRGYQGRWPHLNYHVLAHPIGQRRTGHPASVLFAPGAARPLARYRPDVIHIIGEATDLSTWQVIGWRDRYWPDVPITVYAAQNAVTRLPAVPYLRRRAYRAVRHTFPLTPGALRTLRAKGYRGSATVVPLGVDTTLFTPPVRRSAPDRFTVGFVGRLEPHKGVTDLLRAAERVNCDLLVVGRGSLTGAVRRAAERRPGRVTLTHWTNHEGLPDLLSRMDALVWPSIDTVRGDFMGGQVLVEAMACGVPVVASEVGEIPNVVGTSGLTFPPGDIPALCVRLVKLRDDPELARRLGEDGARRAVTEFGWHQVAESMREVWAALAAIPAQHHLPRPTVPATYPPHGRSLFQPAYKPAITTVAALGQPLELPAEPRTAPPQVRHHQ